MRTFLIASSPFASCTNSKKKIKSQHTKRKFISLINANITTKQAHTKKAYTQQILFLFDLLFFFSFHLNREANQKLGNKINGVFFRHAIQIHWIETEVTAFFFCKSKEEYNFLLFSGKMQEICLIRKKNDFSYFLLT